MQVSETPGTLVVDSNAAIAELYTQDRAMNGLSYAQTVRGVPLQKPACFRIELLLAGALIRTEKVTVRFLSLRQQEQFLLYSLRWLPLPVSSARPIART
jgi:hypothetical protein